MLSCSGEIYEDQIIVKEDGIAYNKETDKVFSGDVLDKYGELVGVYKKGLKEEYDNDFLNRLINQFGKPI